MSLLRYWQTREQRAPASIKGKPQSKGSMEDQEQHDPMGFVQSDEENGEEEDAGEEEKEKEKGSQGGAAKRRLQEQRERYHGALALIELANNLSG